MGEGSISCVLCLGPRRQFLVLSKPFIPERYLPKDPAKFTDFERKYPIDPYAIFLTAITPIRAQYCPRFGAEAGDNGRVWRVYQDRANDMDADTILGWNDTINFLLVFVRR